MIKKFLSAVALLSLALASGCAKGGNGIVITPTVAISAQTGTSPSAIYPTQTVVFTAMTTDPKYAPVNWAVTGGGTITSTTPPDASTMTSATATYVAPATVGAQPQLTATFTSDSSIADTLDLIIVDITTQVSPATLTVGAGLTQQFIAVASPDAAPQTFNWTCTANGVACTKFVQDPNISGLASYTALDSCGTGCNVQVSAVTPLDPTGCVANPKYCILAKFPLVTSRVSGTYAFRFSGYDNNNHPVVVAGTFTADANGNITSGVEDELTSSGPNKQIAISGGSYTPTSSDPDNSNNAGTLTLTLPGGIHPSQFQVVLDGGGDIQMIESDGHGSGSGVAEPQTASNHFNSGDQTYAFGFTGVDSAGNRIGYAGLMPIDGSGNVTGGSIDVNDNGSATDSICSAPPCTVTGTYSALANGTWKLALTSPVALTFDFYVANGTTKATTPLTLYAISTDSNPAVVGTMVLQDSTQTYNNSAFNGVSVSALTGVSGANTNVSLTQGETDGNGNFYGQFDQNNAGTVLIYPSPTIMPPQPAFAYTYKADSSTDGRYTFQMLGNPGASPAIAPLPFVLYASGANRGFLLDQSSTSVMTGTMTPQGKGGGNYGPSALAGTYAAATTSAANSSVGPLAANLLFTSLGINSAGKGTYDVAGTLYPGEQAVPTGSTYTLTDIGTGTIVFNYGMPPPIQNYAIYTIDTAGGCAGFPSPNPACAIQDFLMIDEDPNPNPNPNPSVIFAHQ